MTDFKRAQIIKILEEQKYEYNRQHNNNDDVNETYDVAINAIRNQVNDEERVIKTELIDIKRYGYKYKKCGNCNEEFLEQYVYRWFFCPRCGAKFINVAQ